TFDVATWNVMRFGNDGLPPEDSVQIENVRRVIAESGVELWALQEVEDRRDFQRLLTSLGDEWAGYVDPSSSNLSLAYVYRADAVRPIRTRSILGDHAARFASRPPAFLEAEVKTR